MRATGHVVKGELIRPRHRSNDCGSRGGRAQRVQQLLRGRLGPLRQLALPRRLLVNIAQQQREGRPDGPLARVSPRILRRGQDVEGQQRRVTRHSRAAAAAAAVVRVPLVCVLLLLQMRGCEGAVCD